MSLSLNKSPPFNQVSLVSVGQQTLSQKYVNNNLEITKKKGIAVCMVDIREYLPRDATQSEVTYGAVDGSAELAQRSVFVHKGFVPCCKYIIDQTVETTLHNDKIIVIVKSTSGTKRSYVVAEVLVELLNSVHDGNGRVFNCKHFNLAANKWESQCDNTWRSVVQWCRDPWCITRAPKEALEHKFGYKAAAARNDGFRNLTEVWGYIVLMNSYGEPKAETLSQTKCIDIYVYAYAYKLQHSTPDTR